ncbi:hypothetical protein EMCRGX_G031930 [Ephydatia muelleri]|eukprot:Em0018g76a
MALRVVAKRLITSFHRPTLVVGPLQRYALSTSSVRYLDVKDLEKAKGALSALKEDPGNDVKLKLYGFYKQATVGACNTEKPGTFDFVGRAKWSAWNSLGNLSKEAAIEQYCKVVAELVGSQVPSSSQASTTQEYQHIVVTTEGGVRTILLNRPTKKNALNYQMYSEIQEAMKAAGEDKSVVVTVLTGAGDYYCSGNDLSNFATIPPEGPKALAAQGKKVLLAFVSGFIHFPKPLVAAVNGPAVGLSVTLLGLCDFVYASEQATFHTPFMSLGQSPEGCSSYLFPRIMGAARANEVLMGGRKLTATEAYERGLVTRVFSQDEFKQKVKETVGELAKMPPQSLQKTKQLLRWVDRDKLDRVNAYECDVLEERWLSEECMKAILDFMQRKKT